MRKSYSRTAAYSNDIQGLPRAAVACAHSYIFSSSSSCSEVIDSPSKARTRSARAAWSMISSGRLQPVIIISTCRAAAIQLAQGVATSCPCAPSRAASSIAPSCSRRVAVVWDQRLRARRGRPAIETRTDRLWRRGGGHRRAGSSSAASTRERRADVGARTSAASRTAPRGPLPLLSSERRRGDCPGSEAAAAASRWLSYRCGK